MHDYITHEPALALLTSLSEHIPDFTMTVAYNKTQIELLSIDFRLYS